MRVTETPFGRMVDEESFSGTVDFQCLPGGHLSRLDDFEFGGDQLLITRQAGIQTVHGVIQRHSGGRKPPADVAKALLNGLVDSKAFVVGALGRPFPRGLLEPQADSGKVRPAVQDARGVGDQKAIAFFTDPIGDRDATVENDLSTGKSVEAAEGDMWGAYDSGPIRFDEEGGQSARAVTRAGNDEMQGGDMAIADTDLPAGQYIGVLVHAFRS
jgi:hypothetical protein